MWWVAFFVFSGCIMSLLLSDSPIIVRVVMCLNIAIAILLNQDEEVFSLWTYGCFEISVNFIALFLGYRSLEEEKLHSLAIIHWFLSVLIVIFFGKKRHNKDIGRR